MPKAICQNCKKEFHIANWQERTKPNKFCSRKCRTEFGREEVKCIECGKEFNATKSAKRKFCSFGCMWKNKEWRKDKGFKKGHPSYLTEKSKRKMSISAVKRFTNLIERNKMRDSQKALVLAGKHHLWRDGISFEPYGLEFNKELKEQIRKRDDYKCQECGYTEKQLGYKLSIHHIDYNKKNNKPNNLISLCKSCHSKTSFNRENWVEYYNNKLLNYA